MARDLRSIAHSLGGTLVPGGGFDARSHVGSALRVSDFALAPHPHFASIVVGTAHEIAQVLRDEERGAALRDAVVVPTTPFAELPDGLAAIIDVTVPSEAVLSTAQALLANDAAAEDRAVLVAAKVLALTARRGGVSGVVAELAHRLDGWAVLLDRAAQPIASSGAGSLHIADAVAVAFHRPVRVRSQALQVHPVGINEDVSAFLVVMARSGSTSRVRDLSSQAAALLDLLLRTHDSSRTERLGRATMMRVLEDGGVSAERTAQDWGIRDRSLTAFSISARSADVDVERVVIRWLDELGAAHLLTTSRGVTSGFVREEHVADIAQRTAELAIPLHVGFGAPASIDALAVSAEQSRRARDVAVSERRGVVHYNEIPTVALVLDRLSPADSTRLATLLAPLRGTDLVETLHAFLRTNGTWGTAASDLGIHRQTLAARIRRVEELTGLSMTSPDDRATAWLALRAVRHTD